jgi:short-subunit dehydrogenase
MMRTARASSVAIVTGASSGIGQACAELLTARGCRVFGVSRTPPAEGYRFEWIKMDVSDDESVRKGMRYALGIDSQIDILVNSAGYGLAGAVADTTMEEARHQFEVNFFGTLRMCQEVLPSMIAHCSGVIVNVGSLAGLIGLPFQGVYSATKFALEGLTESLRHEVMPFGVDVVLVEPGDVCTNITRNRVRAARGVGSVYAQHYEAVMRIVEREEMNGASVAAVAELIVSVCESRSRRIRYTCGHLSQRSVAWAKRLLPGRLVERLIGDHYRVARRAPPRMGDGADLRNSGVPQ